MPEVAEIKIMSDYINQVCSHLTFQKIEKEPNSKKENLQIEGEFTISSLARGKELKIILASQNKNIEINFWMGMSGNWNLIKNDQQPPKHSQLKFIGPTHTLHLIDSRHFAGWKILTGWSNNRGPCIMTQTQELQSYIINLAQKNKLNKPLYMLMMDQKYFNGCGNYLRAEILGETNINPFQNSNQFFSNPTPERDLFFENCYNISNKAYVIGGGKLSTYKNPFGLEIEMGKNWMKFYSNPQCSWIEDSTGRRFWFDPKWKNSKE